jgi:DNA polymerase-1
LAIPKLKAPPVTICNDWRELPFSEVWVVDSEYYPGPGFANGGRDGDAPTPLCVVAIEMRTGRVVRQWQGEFTPLPPYRLDKGVVFWAYMNTAEFGTHLALGWGKPACTLDAYIEFRHHTNDGKISSEDRAKEDKARGGGKGKGGFYSLAGALRYFGVDPIDTAHKKDMRDRILQGPPFSAVEREQILDYCEDDVRALMRLIPRLAPTIRSLPQALARGDYTWLLALQERRGIPTNLPQLEGIRARWDPIRCELVHEKDHYGCYEIENGVPHWRSQRFADYVKRCGMAWPTYADGKLDEREQTFRDMAGRYPEVESLRDLRYTLSKLRLNDLAVGHDGRNRCLLGPYGTKTARNAPSTTRFIFGPAKWLRFLIAPPPGCALIHRDYAQQEVRIAAILSGDRALFAACEAGDVYLGIATQLGFIRGGMSEAEIANVRAMFKIVVLAIMYGLGPWTLAMQTGMSFFDACETLARLRARFHGFAAYAESVVDHAGLNLEIGTQFGWTMQCPPGIKRNTVINFPIQSTAAEVLHVGCALAERRHIAIVAPVHDALMAIAPLDQAEEISIALDRVMRDAAIVVLRGYELPTDGKIIRPGEHFVEKRGQEMWDAIQRLLVKLEEKRA